MIRSLILMLTFAIAGVDSLPAGDLFSPWQRHTVDASFRGADGVRLADFDGDGLQDIVTGWEESGVVRVYLNPGANAAKELWPAVTVGKAKSPEDAVAIDVDGDGQLDVLSCHEGKANAVYVHWNQTGQSREELLKPSNWKSERFPKLDGERWMFAAPLGEIDGRRAIVLGSKNNNASITLLQSPAGADQSLKNWTVTKLRVAGWIMSLRPLDMDGDGDLDIVYSDRKGNNRGIGWLEQRSADDWQDHLVGGVDDEIMFITPSPQRILAAARDGEWLEIQRTAAGWNEQRHPNPPGVIWGKAITSLGPDQLVMTANTTGPAGVGDVPGIWFSADGTSWSAIDSETRCKYDRIECIDLDGDGDLDVLTCEELRLLGVVWYENPQK